MGGGGGETKRWGTRAQVGFTEKNKGMAGHAASQEVRDLKNSIGVGRELGSGGRGELAEGGRFYVSNFILRPPRGG